MVAGAAPVLCGDATRPEDVTHVLGRLKPFLMVTDAPYGVFLLSHLEGGCRTQQDTNGKNWARLQTTIASIGARHISFFLAMSFTPGTQEFMRPGRRWIDVDRFRNPNPDHLEQAALRNESRTLPLGPRALLARGAQGAKGKWCGDRRRSTVWQVPNLNPIGGDRNEKATGHGTQKPIELMRRPIVNHTKRSDAVYDPFLGSGTTMMAAELTERACCGIDIDPRYVDVAVIRWQEFTGKKAVLDGSGLSFEAIAAERLHVAV